MSITSNPVINSSLSPAQIATGINPIRMLICGQIGKTGTAISGQAYQEVQNMSQSQLQGLFGANSELTGRILRTLTISGGYVSLWVVALSPATGATAATFSITIGGTATSAYSVEIKLIDSELYTINLSGNAGDTAATIATNINSAISAFVDFPATAVLTPPATMVFTANDAGTLGNKYALYANGIPAGITVTSQSFTPGATDPALTGIFTSIPSTRFHSISWPWQTNYSTVESYLTSRLVINNAILQGTAYIGYDDTETNIHNNLNGATPVNSPVLVFMGNRQVSGTSILVTPPDWRAAEFMAIEALRLTVNAPIAPYVTTSSPLDLLGGPGMASLPLFNTPLPNTDVEIPDNLFVVTEQINAIVDGYSVIGVNSSVSSAITGQVVTTYKYNTVGQTDPSFKFQENIRTGYTALEYMFNNLKQTYAQTRLTPGVPVAGRAMVNVTGISLFFQLMFNTLSGPGYVLTPAGREAAEYFASNLNLTPDYSTGTINVIGVLPIVTPLRQINMPFQLSFTIGGN